jgi:hypothetical protein
MSTTVGEVLYKNKMRDSQILTWDVEQQLDGLMWRAMVASRVRAEVECSDSISFAQWITSWQSCHHEDRWTLQQQSKIWEDRRRSAINISLQIHAPLTAYQWCKRTTAHNGDWGLPFHQQYSQARDSFEMSYASHDLHSRVQQQQRAIRSGNQGFKGYRNFD